MGVGTGRCGTTSLAKIIDYCKNTFVGHELYQLMWYEVTSELGRMIIEMRKVARSGVLCGDTSSAYLPNIGHLRDSFKDMPVVCLHRDKESTVESFMDYGLRCIRPGDKQGWVDRCMGPNVRAKAQGCFPIIDAATHHQAFGFYWEFCEALMEKIPEPVCHLDINDLNDDAKLHMLFDFLSIPECDRLYMEERRFWTRKDAQAFRKEMSRAGPPPRPAR